MIQKKSVGSFVLIILCLTSCLPKRNSLYRRKENLRKVFYASPLQEGPVTIFVHGTKTSLISRLVHQTDYPIGIHAAKDIQTKSVMTRISYQLHQADPCDFPLDSFYYYTWPGKLTFDSRLRAAEQLYSVIRFHKGPITLITHSHGCNVVLNLAYCAQKNHDTSFAIDRLILLAPPVQEVTKPYVHSPIFKRVYTFYSSADLMQVGDPQALYWESYAFTQPYTHIPLLSRRTFDPAPHIIQTRILLDWQSPGHLNFLLKRFISRMPELIKLVTAAQENNGYECSRNQFIVNIPPLKAPIHLVAPDEIKGRYIPRSTYHKTRRLLRSASKSDKSCGIKQN